MNFLNKLQVYVTIILMNEDCCLIREEVLLQQFIY
jgi:hypothetical protein